MNNDAFAKKFSLPMRWLAVVAAIEFGLVMLSATVVQSEPLNVAQAPATTMVSRIVSYAHQVSQAIVRTETAVLPVETADQLR
jgi:hypothetical protein